MTENSKIEWTHHTFNPWIGCTKVSPGCDHCYAEALVVNRFKKDVWGPGKARELTSEKNWSEPLKWNKRAEEGGVRERVFCASLADIFDNEIPEEWRVRLWELVYATPNLDWLILTKRIGNARHMMPLGAFRDGPLPNLWIGASIVNQQEADRDIPKLLDIPARVRFLSMEPLLGPVKLSGIQCEGCGYTEADKRFQLDHHLCKNKTATINWIIVGGESGREARPMHPDWARDLRDQCVFAGVPFFFKQWGEWFPWKPMNGNSLKLPVQHVMQNASEYYPGNYSSSLQSMIRVGKKMAGRHLDDREWSEYPNG